LVVPSTEIPFFAAVAYHIERAAHLKGYNVILCNSEWELWRELDHLHDLLARRVDGLVCISAEITADQIEPILEAETPVVMFERQVSGLGLDAVGIDNYCGGYAGTRHLLDIGHCRIAFVEGLPASSVSGERLQGCRHALEEAGLSLDRTLLFRGDYRPESGRRAADAALSLDEPPTAIFAFNDLMALGVLQKLDRHRVRVPEDVAVLGFDGIPLTAYTSPALSTLQQPLAEMGVAAVELLLDRIAGEGPDEPQFIQMMPELIVRDSTVRQP
jgi:LacI family transcriptional regulator